MSVLSLIGLHVKNRKEMSVRRVDPTQTPEERQQMLAGAFAAERRAGFRLSADHERVSEALTLLQRLEDFKGSVQAAEVQRTRLLLRVGAIEAYTQQRYSDALLQVLHSYLLARSFYTSYQSMPLEGEMVPELLLLTKCCGLVGRLEQGKQFLDELRFIVENTLIYVASGGGGGGAKASAPPGKAPAAAGSINRGSVQGPVMSVEKHVLAAVVSSLAELCSLYGQPENANLFYEKYIILMKDVYGADSLTVSDALNTVALFFFQTRQYAEAVPLVEQVLDIRKKHLGDFDSPQPNPRVADCYANLGLLYRLLGKEQTHRFSRIPKVASLLFIG
ncbi:formin frm1 [Cystoisospora suis]|uniref:Formin frm1 n=1 Tax=Cystoisospora suis TaxID=483139 RepID=A0A2C6KR37_9APIC|nr:formin frm1 [Cystoisospora suis]